MGEISQLLEILAAKGHFTYSAGALTGWPGFPPWVDTDRANAVEAWNAWAAAMPADGSGRADRLEFWLMTHILLDLLVFAPAYVFGLYLLLRWMLDFRAGTGQSAAIPFGLTGITILVFALLVADWAETGVTCGLVYAEGGSIGTWACAVAWLSSVKWLLLAAVVFLGAAVFVVDILPGILTRWFIRWRSSISRASRSWTRHRMQLAVLAVLTALIALPGGGPLEQVPDIQRAWVHDSPWKGLLADIAGPGLTLAGLCAALWVAGRWALLDGLAGKRKKARSKWGFFFLPLGAFVALALVWPAWSGRLREEPFAHNAGGLAIPVVALAIAVLGAFVVGDDPAERWVDLPIARAKVETIGRALTVVPLVIAGLGLVRAFARPVLLGSLIDSGVDRRWILVWFLGGLVLTFLVPPLIYWLLRHAEISLFGEPGTATARQLQRRVRLPRAVGAFLLFLVCLLGVLTAVFPLDAGAWLRTLGVLSLMLATVVLFGALFIRRAESREPYRAFRALRFRFTPIWLPVLALLATQSMLDNSGVYHAVRLHPVEASTDNVAPFSAQKEFGDWYKQAAACAHGAENEAIPMLFVAAAGGGIRAAYWTSAAMDRLTDASPCARSYSFALSGVSGGSLGLAAHTLTSWQPAGTKSSEAVRKLADEDALAANVAALLYRDGTHAFHGLNHAYNSTIGDRASVFERAWEQTDKDGWERELSSATLRDNVWRPFLLMNGTDVASGCRIAVAARRTTGVALADERLRCQKPNIALRGAQFATATVDAVAFNDGANCATLNRGLRMSTAAHLSARFTYVSPSGTMYRCAQEGEGDPPATSSISSIDGGYLEGSGMAALLEFWSAVEPAVATQNLKVAAHNLTATAKPEAKLPYVVPLVVLLDSHYSVKAPDPEIEPLNELIAPVSGRRARTTAARTATLQQAALVRFTGPLPGTTLEVASPTRSFLVAPRAAPQMAAPLGWVLSEMSINSMRTQLTTLATEASDPSEDTLNGRLVARQLSDLIRLLKGPVSLRPTPAASGS
ncbi:hypothetical protein [Streptomyces sp. NPDC059979]|uniref:hypothetical protein n=1 Tax=Streptomyces sp. NPDC059979 TaxID=3347021 RepID=UPI0036BF7F1D